MYFIQFVYMLCKYWWILSVAIYSYVLPEAGKICICLSKRDIKFSASTSPANTPFSWLFTEFLEFRNCEISIFNVRNVFYNIQVRVWIKGDIVFKRKFYLFFLKAPPSRHGKYECPVVVRVKYVIDFIMKKSR